MGEFQELEPIEGLKFLQFLQIYTELVEMIFAYFILKMEQIMPRSILIALYVPSLLHGIGKLEKV